MKLDQAARLLLLVLAVTAGGVVVLVLATPWLPPPVAGALPLVSAADHPAAPGFTGVVTGACAVAAVGCWAWLALGTVVVALEALLAPAASSRRRLAWVPGTLRVLVPVVLGAAVSAGPAAASTGTAPAPNADALVDTAGTARTGLPFPDRVLTDRAVLRPAHRPEPRSVQVRPGDTLWGITTRLLPPGSTPAAVDRGWRRIARANADRLPDPDLILPGTRLRVPPPTTHPREEAR